MKKSALIIAILSLCLLIGKRAAAQDYRTAVGLKFDYESGPSIKYFFQKDAALEGMIGFRSHGVVFSGLYEKYIPAFDVPQLNFYYGFGGHLGAVGSGTYHRFSGDNIDNSNNSILIGADGVVGLEYLIPNSPIAISLDLNPRLEIAYGGFFDIAPGIGLKYTF